MAFWGRSERLQITHILSTGIVCQLLAVLVQGRVHRAMSTVLNAATGFGLLSHQESLSHLVTVVLVAEGRLITGCRFRFR